MPKAARIFNSILCAVLLTAIAGCQRERGGTSAVDLDAVRSADVALQEAITAKDLERTLAFYADDASMLPVAEPIVTGREAIRSYWRHIFAIPGSHQNTSKLSRVEVSRAGDLAYTQGTYANQFDLADGTTATERGKWVSVWKKQADGTWKVAVDIYNTDEPPPAHQ